MYVCMCVYLYIHTRSLTPSSLTKSYVCSGTHVCVCGVCLCVGASAVKSLKYGHVTRVKLGPETGRTHQIRRHLLEIGHPIGTTYSSMTLESC